MKKRWIIGILILGIVILISYTYLNSRLLTHFNVVSINISDKKIDLKVDTNYSGTQYYWGYKADYRGEALYIKVKASTFPLPGVSKNGFNISIPNKYGEIKKIYLHDDTKSTDNLIWPQTKK